jgi:hypothetical protein
VIGGCSGGCVDVWSINCKSDETHTVGAAAKDPLAPFHQIKVTAVGLTKPRLLLNRADIQFGNAYLSLWAALSRPGYEHGPSKALVMISAAAPTSYHVEFFCHDDQGQNVGDPVVTLLQDF